MEYPTRAEAFPVGLRVLVVDDDPTWLKILEKMLRKCSYEVTTCCLARVALELLRERKEKFDIVLSDVNMPDMDGFKLLEYVGLEMDLPVIMMSVDGETSRVMKGVQHGACDYLLKPIRMKELRNIWQHVYRKKIHEVREIEGHDISENIQLFRTFSEDFDDRQVSGGGDQNYLRKRKDFDGKEYSDQEVNDSSSVKKARVVWSVDLHQKFVNAVNQIGFDKVGPKKILDMMNVPGLTRENVASHLQKYRLYLSRLQKQNVAKSYSRRVQSEFSTKDSQAKFGLQNPTTIHQNNGAGKYVPVSHSFEAQSKTPDIHIDQKCSVALEVKDRVEAVKNDVSNTRKTNGAPPLGVVLSFKGTMSNVDYKSAEPSISMNQPWSGGIRMKQFLQYLKHDHKPYNLLDDYSSMPLTSQVHQSTCGQFQNPPSIISVNAEKEKTGITQITPVFANYGGRNNKSIAPVTCTIDTVSVQVDRGVITSQDFGAKHENNGSINWISPSREPITKNGIDSISIPEDLPLRSLQNVGCFENVGFNTMEIFQYNDSVSPSELQTNWYDNLELNWEYLYDSVEYPIVDDCLFA